LLSNFFSQSSNILISNGGTVSVSNGDKFYDAGGPTGNDGNTDFTITLCPSVSGERVVLDFTTFKTHFSSMWNEEDALFIYDANSVSGSNIGKLMGDYTIKYNSSVTPNGEGVEEDGSGNPAILRPTMFGATNSSGCLTLVFDNDYSDQWPGWEADIITYKPVGSPICEINIDADTNSICSGESTNLLANGINITTPLNNDFNSGALGDGWLATSNVSFTDNACGVSNDDGSTYLWFQDAPAPRSLETNDLDVSNGGDISFDYRQASDNGGSSPCEAPDQQGGTFEGIYVQYSIDQGTSWTTFKYIFPNATTGSFGAEAALTGCGDYVKQWTKMIYPIPVAAHTPSTRFRWIQTKVTGSGSKDNWGLDNVIISTSTSFNITIEEQSTGNVVASSTSETNLEVLASPSSSETYVATITDPNSSNSCNQTIDIVVNSCPPPSNDCGTCDSPDCAIDGPYSDFTDADNNYFNGAQNFSPAIVNEEVVTYHLVNSGPTGIIGFAISHSSADVNTSLGCITNTQRTAVLYPLGCTGASISPTIGADNDPYYNPEFLNLTPNTDYVLVVTTSAVTDCEVETSFVTYYEISSTCDANVGTITVDINGSNVSGTDLDIPYGQTATFNASGYTLPNDGPSGSAGMVLALFSCEPQAASLLSPFDVSADPCYLGIAASDNVPTNNDGTGTSLNGEVWAVYLTFDHASSSGGPDTDGDDCVDVSAVYHITYLPENPPPSSDCGSCSTPDCDIGSVPTYADRFPPDYFLDPGQGAQVCNTLSSSVSGTYITYQTVQASPTNGTLGAYVQALQTSGTDPILPASVSITQELYALSDCGGSNIIADVGNNVHNRSSASGSWNPEWTGLIPGANYILVTTFTIVDGDMDSYCMDYYWDPTQPPTPGPCEMQNGSITTCDCEFKDSGGDTDSYSSNEDYTYTICPDDGTKVRFTLTEINLGPGDVLTVYDGSDNTAPMLFQEDDITTIPGYNIEATPSNSSGCLTFHFESNSSLELAGWLGDITCFSLCTDPVAEENSGTIKICKDGTVNLDASSSIANASGGMDSYQWDFDDGSTGTGITTSHTYSLPGRYIPKLVVYNDDGCYSKNAISTEVLVGTVPNFLGTETGNTCVDGQICLNGVVTWPSATNVPIITPPGITEIPETAGNEAIEITISGYDIGQQITSASDILRVFVNMEHSAIDDIILTLIAPSGESVMFHNRGGQAIALGEPSMAGAALEGLCFNPVTNGNGVGYDYYFVNGATETLLDHANANWATPYVCYSIPSGNYAPLDPFSNLIGADINGTWTLEFQDVYPNDNGTVFDWWIEFDESLIPSSAIVQPVIDTYSWSDTYLDIDSQNGQNVCITPTDDNNTDYTFTVTDDFGCTFDTTISLIITTSITNTVNETICNGDTVEYNGTLYHATNLTGTHILSATSGCDSIVTYNIIEEPPITNSVNENICNGGSFVYDDITYDGSNPTGIHILTTSSGCDSTVTFSIIEESPITNTVNEVICNGASFDYYGTIYNATNPIGLHVLTSSSGCDSTVTFSITEESPITSSVNESICNGGSFDYDGITYDASNPTGIHVLTTLSGCDSTITFSITEESPITNTVIETICETGSFIYYGTTYDETNTTGTHVLISSNGCDSTVTVNVTIQSSSTSLLDSTVCYGESLIVNGNTYDGSNPSGQEILVSSIGCDSTVLINLVELIPDTSFIDTVIYVGQSLDIAGQVLVESDFEGLVYIESISSGCDSIISAKVKMLYESAHFVPTGFSPNGDGNNDVIGVMGGGITEINFYIYNRWGEKVFSYVGGYNDFCPDDPLCNWDGTYNNQPVNVETYVYYLKGTYSNGEDFTEKGTISLIK
jgi:gliding motility-associated-like protein